MAKFKVGEKIRCIDDSDIFYGIIKNGGVYTVADCGETIVKLAEDYGLYMANRFVPVISDSDRIADLERQLETWKVIQRTNDTTIKIWQDIHQKDQQCLIYLVKQLNRVTAENVRLKKYREDMEKMLIDDAIDSIEQAANINEEKEIQAIFEAINESI